MRFALIFLLVFGTWSGPAISKEIARACLRSERGAGQQKLCSCIQTIATRTLNARDQERAVGLFADPELAETTRRSDTRRDEAFWDRYERFGETAQKYCRKNR